MNLNSDEMTVLLVGAVEGFVFRGIPLLGCKPALLPNLGGKVLETFSGTLSTRFDDFSTSFDTISTVCAEVLSVTLLLTEIWGGLGLNLAVRSTFFLFDSEAFFLKTRKVGFLTEAVDSDFGLETKLTIGVRSDGYSVEAGLT